MRTRSWLLRFFSPGGDPVHGQEFLEFGGCRVGHAHEFFEYPFEVGVGIEAVAADLFDEGIDDGTAPAGFLGSDEHPVLGAEFGGTDRAFGVVVVKFDLAVEEARFEVRPLVPGVAERFAELAFGKDSAGFFLLFEMVEEFFEVIVVSAGLEPAGALPVERGGTFFLQALFDAVDFADLADDPSADSRVVLPGIPELASDMGEAADGDDGGLGLALDEGAVGSQAVALKVAAEGGVSFEVDEDFVEARIGAALMPVKERAVFGVLIDPEVAGGGFSFSGFKAGDGGFVDADVVAGAKASGDEPVGREEAFGKVVVPVAHVVAGDFDPVAGPEFPLLAVKGAVVAKFLGEQICAEGWGEDTAGKEAGFERRGDGDGVGVVL